MVALVLCVSHIDVSAAWAKSGYDVVLESAGGGQYQFLFTRDDIRVKSVSFNYWILAHAPDWRVHVYRDDAKTESLCSVQEYKQVKDSIPGTGSTLDLEHPSKVARIKIEKKFDGWEYIYPGGNRATELFRTERQAQLSRVSLKTLDLGMPPELCKIAQSTVNMPHINGYLTEGTEYFVGGGVCWMVRPRHFRAVPNVDDKSFSPPHGYKKVGKLKPEFLFQSVSGLMDGIIDGMGDKDFNAKQTPGAKKLAK